MTRRLRLALFMIAVLVSVAVAAAVPRNPTAPGAREGAAAAADSVYLRVNLVGYRTDDPKVAVVFSERPVSGEAVLETADGQALRSFELTRSAAEGLGRFDHYYEVDFSDWTEPGKFVLSIPSANARSVPVHVGDEVYAGTQDRLLEFMRQQRCGYNPFLDMVCHRRDGRTAYGPLPESSFVDVSGGWHDAGDQLKYLITSSYATAHMLIAHELAPGAFADEVDAMGRRGNNGVPDVLDEARWGLDWMHRMHPQTGHLYHQIADDRDHIGWKSPDRDSSDYGWGPNSYRTAYFADGEPQGLGSYQSRATGIANLAGRFAATMALAYRAYAERGETDFATKSLEAALDTYRMGRENEGYQQGNSYGAPYRYGEDTWADDMEWGAAELFAATGDSTYLADAKRYARLSGGTSVLVPDSSEHYRLYPFVNIGHFALHPHVDAAFQDTLASYYRESIEAALERGRTNPFLVGVPFIWCSNNLAAALITQILLYEQMTGDRRYHAFMIAQRDWLLGRNPWGTSMFTGIPADGEFPLDVHTSVWALTGRMVPGGLVDGPVYATIYRSLSGLRLSEPDEFAHLQNPFVVYHDDIGDYSTNEPTMDGTAGAVYMMAYFADPDPDPDSGPDPGPDPDSGRSSR